MKSLLSLLLILSLICTPLFADEQRDKIDELREAGKDHKKLAEIAENAKEKLGLTEHQMDALKNWKDKSSHASTMEGVKDLKESLAALKTKDVMERLKRTREALKAGQNDPRSEL